jgi:hypothetical protein
LQGSVVNNYRLIIVVNYKKDPVASAVNITYLRESSRAVYINSFSGVIYFYLRTILIATRIAKPHQSNAIKVDSACGKSIDTSRRSVHLKAWRSSAERDRLKRVVKKNARAVANKGGIADGRIACP